MVSYEELCRRNVAEAIQRLGYRMELDGTVQLPYVMEPETPWVIVGKSKHRECLKWLHVYFQHFRVIHPGCLSCWKTYYVPKTVRELFEIAEEQRSEPERGIVNAAKCGIEKRGITGRLGGYGAFWYNPLGVGLGQARQNTERLARHYGKELRLKRGCTEMEHFTVKHLGLDSSQWSQLYDVGREKIEQLERIFFLDERQFGPTLPIVRDNAYRVWIEWAAEHGDKTYLDFVSAPFFPELREYRNSIDTVREVDDGTIWRDYTKRSGSKPVSNKLCCRTKETCITSLADA